MDVDERGFRVALVADELVNPAADGIDVLEVLREEDWGVIQLPPGWYPADVAAPLLEQIVGFLDKYRQVPSNHQGLLPPGLGRLSPLR